MSPLVLLMLCLESLCAQVWPTVCRVTGQEGKVALFQLRPTHDHPAKTSKATSPPPLADHRHLRGLDETRAN